jgi:crotonobetainyl-CoA:carnitine CoA-transferase CaiB-like acyl-CoA transferase
LIEDTVMNEMLKGIRVVDLTRVLAGPYATRILADFSAEVIKVQSNKTATGAEVNTSAYFSAWNRNKRSITLDLSHPEARELFLKLTAISDIVIENFSPRVMANWGLQYQKLIAINPELIMISMSAMGQTGPWKDSVAFGPTIQALSGLTYLTSFDKDSPLGPGYAYGDIVAGLYAVIATLVALEHRDREGNGQYIDLSEYEALSGLIGPALMDSVVNQREILPQGNEPHYLPAAPHGCYRCSGRDRWCAIAVFTDEEWQALKRVMGNPDWAEQERFSERASRQRHARELDALLEQWTVKHDPIGLMQMLQEAGIPAGIVQSAEDLAQDTHLKARGYFVRCKDAGRGFITADAFPAIFTGTRTPRWKAAPLLGEDNHYVFIELLGLEEGELSSYVERGIIS